MSVTQHPHTTLVSRITSREGSAASLESHLSLSVALCSSFLRSLARSGDEGGCSLFTGPTGSPIPTCECRH